MPNTSYHCKFLYQHGTKLGYSIKRIPQSELILFVFHFDLMKHRVSRDRHPTRVFRMHLLLISAIERLVIFIQWCGYFLFIFCQSRLFNFHIFIVSFMCSAKFFFCRISIKIRPSLVFCPSIFSKYKIISWFVILPFQRNWLRHNGQLRR